MPPELIERRLAEERMAALEAEARAREHAARARRCRAQLLLLLSESGQAAGEPDLVPSASRESK